MAKVTTVPYIGEKTAKKLKRKGRGSGFNRMKSGAVTISEAARMPDGLLQVVLSKRQRRKLAEAAGEPEMKFLTREEKTEISSNTQSGSTDPGDNIRRGDFRLDRDLFKEAREIHSKRDEESQELDEDVRARATTDFSQWKDNPDSFDFPGVDTPNKRRVRAEEKDEPFVEEDDLLRDFDELFDE